MIDQSNRAGKFDINGADDLNEQKSSISSCSPIPKCYKRQNRNR